MLEIASSNCNSVIKVGEGLVHVSRELQDLESQSSLMSYIVCSPLIVHANNVIIYERKQQDCY